LQWLWDFYRSISESNKDKLNRDSLYRWRERASSDNMPALVGNVLSLAG